MLKLMVFCCVALGAYRVFGTDSSKTNVDMNFFGNISSNLTKVTWAHAVNSRKLLNEALNSSIMMLEADIVLGKLIDNTTDQNIPVMGHPPADTSDISLEQFLSAVYDFNAETTEKKGVKLDFKTIEVFEKSVPILSNLYDKMTYPVWINADIISGPVNASTTPVDPVRFLNGSRLFSNSVLSIGWTTDYGFINNNASYTNDQVENMLNAIKDNEVTLPITFPVRAGIAANSLENMQKLMASVQNSTLTVWSSALDYVDVEKLRIVIFTVGLDRVYVDVPEELMNKLDLDNPPL